MVKLVWCVLYLYFLFHFLGFSLCMTKRTLSMCRWYSFDDDIVVILLLICLFAFLVHHRRKVCLQNNAYKLTDMVVFLCVVGRHWSDSIMKTTVKERLLRSWLFLAFKIWVLVYVVHHGSVWSFQTLIVILYSNDW